MKGALNQLFKAGHSSTAHGSSEESMSWAWNVQQWKELLNSSLGTASLFPQRTPSTGVGRDRLELQGEEMSLIKPAPHRVISAESFLLHGETMCGDESQRERRLSDVRSDERNDTSVHEPIQIHLQVVPVFMPHISALLYAFLSLHCLKFRHYGTGFCDRSESPNLIYLLMHLTSPLL